MVNSTVARAKAKAALKPREDFPLFIHGTDPNNYRWCKKVLGRLRYFGYWRDDKEGKAAFAKWEAGKADLLAGREPREKKEGALSLGDLCNEFLNAKLDKLDSGELSPRTFRDYKRTAETLIAEFGKFCAVEDLTASDFRKLRASLTKRMGPVALTGAITEVRMVFKFADDEGLIEKPVKYGQAFDKPTRKTLRKVRAQNGKRMFAAAEICKLVETAGQPLKAMLLLAINCGFGQSDLAMLPLETLMSALESGWIDYPRPKTGIERRCKLWRETIAACREALAQRPRAVEADAKDKAFITRWGGLWVKPTGDDAVSKETAKLLRSLKLKRPGLGFYALRHTFQTIGEEARDLTAVRHVMGHSDDSMSAQYREGISDDRLAAVSKTVHKWLFGK
jgi:integrase